MSERILIVGARASQTVHGEVLLNPKVNGGDIPSITFYDNDPSRELRNDLPHMNAARRKGKVALVNVMPKGMFDMAIIAPSSEYHSQVTEEVLRNHGSNPPLFVFEKPLAATEEAFSRFQRLQPYIPPQSLTNEPYLVSRTVGAFRDYIHNMTAQGTPPSDVFAWSSKRRKRQNPHGSLGIFGIELPHSHGAASYLAGRVLDTDDVEENIYFADVDGITGNDGNYLRFRVGNTAVHVAQGLGAFSMDEYGGMVRNSSPPKVRRLGAQFSDHRIIADVETTFCTNDMQNQSTLYGTLERYDSNGRELDKTPIEDNSRHILARYALMRVRQPTSPIFPQISFPSSLARSRALLNLRAQTTEMKGISLL